MTRIGIAETRFAQALEIDVRRVDDPVIVEVAGALEDGFRERLRRRAAMGHVELDAEIAIRSSRIVACRQHEAPDGLVLADDAGGGRGGEKTALPDENATEAVCGSHLQSGLDNRVVEITAVAPDHECGARRPSTVSKIACMKFST